MGRFNIFQRVHRFGARGTLESFGYLGNYYVSKYILRKRLLTRRIQDYQLCLDPWLPGISRTLFISGTREEQLKYVLEQEVLPGSNVLDLGANIGSYTIMLARLVGPSGKVYALEPEPRNFSLLEGNIGLNKMEGQVKAFNIAAGDKKDRLKFYISEYSNMHTFVPHSREGKPSKALTGESLDMEVIDLSSFLNGKLPVDLIRMDIEGYEVEVLIGLRNAIEDGVFQGKIVFEAHFPKYDDKEHSMREQLRWLFEQGYRVSLVTSTDEKKTRLKERGYEPFQLVQTSNTRFRGIYRSISEKDALYFICDVGGIRDVVLSKEID